MSYLKEVSFDSCDSLEEVSFNRNEQKSEGVSPDNIPSLNFSIYDQRLKSLHGVTISYCARLKNVSWLIRAPNVKGLFIHGCDSTEEVIGESDIGGVRLQNDPPIFSTLEELSLTYLPKLRSIYKHVLPFPCLKETWVIECPELKKLPFDSESGKNSFRTLKVARRWWIHWNGTIQLLEMLSSHMSPTHLQLP